MLSTYQIFIYIYIFPAITFSVLQGEAGAHGAKGDAGAKGETVSVSSQLPYFTILIKTEFKTVLLNHSSISI